MEIDKKKREKTTSTPKWSPAMDGIVELWPATSTKYLVVKFEDTTNSPSSRESLLKIWLSTTADELTENADDYIDQVLYGPPKKPRLPVFEDICPSRNNFSASRPWARLLDYYLSHRPSTPCPTGSRQSYASIISKSPNSTNLLPRM